MNVWNYKFLQLLYVMLKKIKVHYFYFGITDTKIIIINEGHKLRGKM
jgi:hypothetical protein